MIPRRIIQYLIVAAFALPIAVCVLIGAAKLLEALHDPDGALVVDRVALLLGIVWVLALVGLPICLGIDRLFDDEDPGEP